MGESAPSNVFEEEIVGPPSEVVSAEKERESISFAQAVSERINSESFKEKMLEFPEKERNSVVGLAVEYNILHPDGFGFEEYLTKLSSTLSSKEVKNFSNSGVKEKLMSEAYINSVSSKFGLSEPFSESDEKQIFEYIADKIFINGYAYHAFNGSFEKSIQEHGLDNSAVPWDVSELSRITEIGKNHGKPMLLGWHAINSEGRTFYDEHPYNLYKYSISSPEWFAQFTSEGFHVPAEGDAKTAFYRRDYEAAKANVLNACVKMKSNSREDIEARKAYENLTDDEEKTIIDAFEKYWDIFCGPNSNPKLALIKKTVFEEDEELKKKYNYENYKDFRKGVILRVNERHGTKYPVDVSLQELVEGALSSRGFGNDQRTENVVAGDSMIIIDLPEYKDIHPESDTSN